MGKIKNIIIGFWCKLFNTNESISKKRLKICLKCQDRDGSWCRICGCLLDAKTRVNDEHCPNNLW